MAEQGPPSQPPPPPLPLPPPPPRPQSLYVFPELFDEKIDREQQLYLFAICGAELGTVRA
jgi:hypothetical protein